MITNYISFYSLTIKVNYKLNKSSCKKNFMKNQSTSFAPFFLFLFLFLFSPAVFSLWIFNLSFVSNAKWLIFKHVKSIGMNQWSYNPVLLSLSFKDVKLMKLEIFIPRLSKKGVKHRIFFFFFLISLFPSLLWCSVNWAYIYVVILLIRKVTRKSIVHKFSIFGKFLRGIESCYKSEILGYNCSQAKSKFLCCITSNQNVSLCLIFNIFQSKQTDSTTHY